VCIPGPNTGKLESCSRRTKPHSCLLCARFIISTVMPLRSSASVRRLDTAHVRNAETWAGENVQATFISIFRGCPRAIPWRHPRRLSHLPPMFMQTPFCRHTTTTRTFHLLTSSMHAIRRIFLTTKWSTRLSAIARSSIASVPPAFYPASVVTFPIQDCHIMKSVTYA